MKCNCERLAALTLLVLWAPVLVLCGIIIRLTSTGPAIYTQVRKGQFEKHFTVYKLRTMVVSPDEASVTKSDDPRITAFGRFLRRTRLDELPQLWNVALGEMSFVGPRPHNQADQEKHTKRFGKRYTNRYLLKPGIFGIAQMRWSRGQSYRRLVACDELFRMRKTPVLCVLICIRSWDPRAIWSKGKTF